MAMVRQHSNGGLGVVPLVYLGYGAVAAAGAAATMWGSCDSWYCLPNLKRSLFYAPEEPLSSGPQSVPPAAPQSLPAMTIPLAWNVDEMLRQTAEQQKAFRQGATYGGQTAQQASPGGTSFNFLGLGKPPETTDEEKTMMLVLAAVAGFAVLAFVIK